MDLKFSALTAYTDNRGRKRYYREALPTGEFWGVWRRSRSAFESQGVFVRHEKDDLGKNFYKVVQILERDLNQYKIVVTPSYHLKDSRGLLEYQITPVQSLCASQIANRLSIDASDAGTGKTYTALVLAREMGLTPCIICTKTGIIDWQRVCDSFNLKPLFIINWQSVKSKKFFYCERSKNQYSGKYFFEWKIPITGNYLLVFDEIHMAAGTNTQNQEIVIAAAGKYNIHVASATIADKIIKLQTIGSLINLFKKEKFFEWLRAEGCVMVDFKKWTTLNEREALARISKVIFPRFGVRVKKDNIPGFPPIQNIAKLYKTDHALKQNEHYKKIQVEIKELKSKGTEASKLVLQVKHRQFAELNKIPILISLIDEQLDNNFSVAVFVNFADTLEQLSTHYKTKCCIHGKQVGNKGEEERRKAIDDFQANKSRLIICNIQAGGVGISLHDIHGGHPRVGIICPTWSALALVQVLGRIHRAGAMSMAMNFLIYAANTIEEKVFEKVVSKIENINALNDGDLAEFEIFEKG
jgi:superfamily II DNA or RNA helicase